MKLYHATGRENRESIEKYGLRIFHPETGEELSITGGVFFSSKLHDESPSIDVWEVDVTGLPLTVDDQDAPFDPEDTWWVLYHPDGIPPERLALLRRHITPDCETASRARVPNRERG